MDFAKSDVAVLSSQSAKMAGLGESYLEKLKGPAVSQYNVDLREVLHKMHRVRMVHRVHIRPTTPPPGGGAVEEARNLDVFRVSRRPLPRAYCLSH